MGRLPRKKTSGVKKKKKTRSETPSTQNRRSESSGTKQPVELTSIKGGDAKKVKSVAQKKSNAAASTAAVKTKENFLTTVVQFLREVKIELKKVVWPSRKQTIGSTAVVIVLVLLISFFLGMVDIGLSSLIRFILH
jgi:preprotein translocase subunit SecE